MSDVAHAAPQSETPAPAPLPNSPEARTPDGTLKDQTAASGTPTPETKSESKPETKPVDGKAPETYAEFKAPEGLTLNKEAVDAALPVFKELGLTQDQAQQLVNLQAAREAASAKAGETAYLAMREGWKKDVLADTSLSSGTDLKPEVKQTLARAIDSMGASEAAAFREMTNATGVGDNPVFIRGLLALAKQVTEGRPVSAGGPSALGQTAPGSSAKPTVAKALFPNNP